jgi:hypothetical protein
MHASPGQFGSALFKLHASPIYFPLRVDLPDPINNPRRLFKVSLMPIVTCAGLVVHEPIPHSGHFEALQKLIPVRGRFLNALQFLEAVFVNVLKTPSFAAGTTPRDNHVYRLSTF